MYAILHLLSHNLYPYYYGSNIFINCISHKISLSLCLSLSLSLTLSLSLSLCMVEIWRNKVQLSYLQNANCPRKISSSIVYIKDPFLRYWCCLCLGKTCIVLESIISLLHKALIAIKKRIQSKSYLILFPSSFYFWFLDLF